MQVAVSMKKLPGTCFAGGGANELELRRSLLPEAGSVRQWRRAKTLSVLGNMGVALDDCRLRFVQKCRRPPQNTPDFGGPTDCFEKLGVFDPNKTRRAYQGRSI